MAKKSQKVFSAILPIVVCFYVYKRENTTTKKPIGF